MGDAGDPKDFSIETISIVVPIYQGVNSLRGLIDEIEAIRTTHPNGEKSFAIDEVVLVNDGSQDGSSGLILDLAQRHDWITPVWLSRNYGQHAATLAGMSSSRGDWVVTMDEDGQHSPSDIEKLFATAKRTNSDLVYADLDAIRSHATWRNRFSSLAKSIATKLLLPGEIKRFSSFRLINGEVARNVSAYAGHGVYLDVALSWVVENVESCKLPNRIETRPNSGYSLKKLISHFWRLVLSSGTRPLRIVTFFGIGASLIATIGGVIVLYGRVFKSVPVAGWTSMIVIVLFFSGLILLSLGILAEYLGTVVRTVIGKPLYTIRSKPRDGSLGKPNR